MQSLSGIVFRRPARALLLGSAVIAGVPAAAQDVVGTEAEEAQAAAAEAEGLGEGTFVLDTIEVTAAPGTTTEDTGSWTTDWMRSATGMPLSQRETPQSTSVITDAQMKDRNITTIGEALDAATGITAVPFDSERTNYYSRGFAIDAYQYDGVPIPRNGIWQFGANNDDMILYDHVEIVRGATGLMQGAGEPGASINYIRKRPTSFVRREVAAAVAWPTGGRAEADISGPLNESGTVRGRLLGAADTREDTLDRYFNERYTGYAAIDVDLTDRTLLNAGISYQSTDADNASWGGLPSRYTDGSLIDWPWGFNLGTDWTYVDTQRTQAFASLEHVFENGWTGRLVYTYDRTDFQGQLGWFPAVAPIDPVTGEGVVASSAGKYDGGYDQSSVNAMLNGDYQALGRTHQFVVGLFGSTGKGDYDDYGVFMGGGSVGDVFDWDGSWPEPVWDANSNARYSNETTQVGVYATTQFHATDALAIIGGARLNWWDGSASTTYVNFPDFNSDDGYQFDAILTPYLGATYDINETFTAYGSITSIYKPQLAQDIDRNYLDPTFGWNYELGLKAGLFDGALYAAAAVFQTDQKDVAQYAGDAVGPNGQTYPYYELIDGTTTRGFELEAAGAINERWNASFGYTYAWSEDDDGERVNPETPTSTLKAATDYRIAGILDDRLTVGGAVRWQSSTDSIIWDGAPNIEQDPYAVFDLNATYDVTDSTELTLSVNNVLDEKYYASTGFYNTVIYGEGIAAELMLRARF